MSYALSLKQYKFISLLANFSTNSTADPPTDVIISGSIDVSSPNSVLEIHVNCGPVVSTAGRAARFALYVDGTNVCQRTTDNANANGILNSRLHWMGSGYPSKTVAVSVTTSVTGAAGPVVSVTPNATNPTSGAHLIIKEWA